MTKTIDALDCGSGLQEVIVPALREGNEVTVINFNWAVHSVYAEMCFAIGKELGFNLVVFTRTNQCRFIKCTSKLVIEPEKST